jgi:2-methylisocitrate lyase-like PEP mutase family enzyme
MDPADLVTAVHDAGAAGCNLEDTDHAAGELRDPEPHAAWLRGVREAASARGYGLVINARVDVFLTALLSGSDRPQRELLPDALRRARAYLDAGVDCVYPITLWEADAVQEFVAGSPGPVNILMTPRALSISELAELGVARISYGGLLQRQAMEQFTGLLGSITSEAKGATSR